jgi:transposase
MPMKVSPLALSTDDREKIEGWLNAHGTPQQVCLRSRIILAAADGQADSAIARELEINRKTVMLWRERFGEAGADSLWDIAPGRGRKPTYSARKIKAIVNATLQTKPEGMTHWSCRTMAEQQGVSKSTISNIWRSHNLKPHRSETFKLSRDIRFLEKLTDVVGLYLNPPDQAIVLCVDEKSQIQALDRTQPGLPMKKGRCGTMTHDYKRNGTTTLFAALEVLQGRVVGQCFERHRPSRVSEVPATSGCRVFGSYTVAPGDGQLRYALPSQSEKLVATPSALRYTFCADQLQLAELGGTLVW